MQTIRRVSPLSSYWSDTQYPSQEAGCMHACMHALHHGSQTYNQLSLSNLGMTEQPTPLIPFNLRKLIYRQLADSQNRA